MTDYMKTETVTYLKEQASQLEVEKPLLITQNGKPRYVVQAVSQYQQQQETLALLKLLTLAEHKASEQSLTLAQVFDDE